MSHGDRQSPHFKTLPGLGHPVSKRNHKAYQQSPLQRWHSQEARLRWFLSQLEDHEARTDLAHWYGELWGRPPRPGQIELAMTALADLGTPQSRVALKTFSTEEPTLKLFQQVCLAHWEDARESGKQ